MDAFCDTLGLVMAGLYGGAVIALFATHPKASWPAIKSIVREALPQHPPRTLPDFVYKK